MSGTEIATLWRRLETWASANAPAMLEELNPGASNADLDALEEAFGHSLPESYRASLRVHNGESDGWPNRVFADMGAYHSTASALDDRKSYLDVAAKVGVDDDDNELADQIESGVITVEGSVRPLIFSADWLPIMNCNGDVFWALDFAPADGGNPGQVIQVDHEGCYWAVVAPDFETFFREYVEALEAGEYAVEEGLATREPTDPLEKARDHLLETAFEKSPSKQELEKKKPGELVYIAGYRSGTVKGDRCQLLIKGGDVRLRGSLRGSNFNQLLRVTVSVGKRRGLGLLGPVHDIVEWEVVD